MEKFQMSPHDICVIYAKFMLFSWKNQFVKIYALCHEIHFVAIYALLCGEKFIQKFSSWRKNEKYEVCIRAG